MYEMLLGYPPFYSEEPMSTCRKIVQWRTHLKFPPEPPLSAEAIDLMRRLMCDVEHRLGRGPPPPTPPPPRRRVRKGERGDERGSLGVRRAAGRTA